MLVEGIHVGELYVVYVVVEVESVGSFGLEVAPLFSLVKVKNEVVVLDRT